MDFSQFAPALIINPGDSLFIASICGFILALPIALFLAFWLSSVKSRGTVVLGAFVGALLGLLIILGFADTLIYSTPLPSANGVSVFFSALLFCAALGISGGILLDALIARRNVKDYRRQPAHE